MQIATSNFRKPTASLTPSAKTQEEAKSTPQDSFTFSPVDVKSGLVFGALGVLPVIGAVSNFGAGMESGFNDNPKGATAGGIGVLSNLGGTVTLAGGLLFGSKIATNVGLGMLGVSGLTAAYAGFF